MIFLLQTKLCSLLVHNLHLVTSSSLNGGRGGGGNYISVCASNALKPYPIHNLEPSIKRAAGINGILTQLISKQLQFIHPKAAGI